MSSSSVGGGGCVPKYDSAENTDRPDSSVDMDGCNVSECEKSAYTVGCSGGLVKSGVGHHGITRYRLDTCTHPASAQVTCVTPPLRNLENEDQRAAWSVVLVTSIHHLPVRRASFHIISRGCLYCGLFLSLYTPSYPLLLAFTRWRPGQNITSLIITVHTDIIIQQLSKLETVGR